METLSPRALSRRPTLAAVMPLPREEVTPPVTKTYFAMGQVLRGFSHAIESVAPRDNRNRHPRGLPFGVDGPRGTCRHGAATDDEISPCCTS